MIKQNREKYQHQYVLMRLIVETKSMMIFDLLQIKFNVNLMKMFFKDHDTVSMSVPFPYNYYYYSFPVH